MVWQRPGRCRALRKGHSATSLSACQRTDREARTRARSVEAALGHLRRANPRTQLLVLGVLPRGWTDAAHVYAWPSMYAPGIAALNAELAAWAARDADAVFLDCGAALLPGGKVRSRGATAPVGAQAMCWEACGVRVPWLHCRTGARWHNY